MDNIDKKILFELNWNCRQTNAEIGKKLRISKQVINYRIKKMEKEKAILGYSTLIDWRKLGFNSIRIYLKWKNISIEKEQEIYNFMRSNPLFMWTVNIEGEFDIGFYVWVKSIPEFSKKWDIFLSKYKKYILDQEIYESVTMEHYPMKVLTETASFEEKIIGQKEKEEFDKKDYALLKIISDKANTSVVDISARMHLTPKAVIYRLKNLEKKGIIQGYNAIIDTNKLGYTLYKIDFYLNDIREKEAMIFFAKAHKNIVYAMRTIGGPEFEIEVMVQNTQELAKVINDIRKQFPKVIDHYRFHRFKETIKQVYLPGE